MSPNFVDPLIRDNSRAHVWSLSRPNIMRVVYIYNDIYTVVDVPAEHVQRSFPTGIVKKRRARKSVYCCNIVYTNKKVGPRAGGRLSLRAGRAWLLQCQTPRRGSKSHVKYLLLRFAAGTRFYYTLYA